MKSFESILGLNKMSILQCQELAKEMGFDKATFDFCGPKGCLKAKWLDAYFGFFQIDGRDGFIMVNDIAFNPDIWCENFAVGE